MKIDLPNSDVVQTDFCNEYTMDTIIAPQKDGKPQKSTLQLTFVPKEKKFVTTTKRPYKSQQIRWDIVTEYVQEYEVLIML